MSETKRDERGRYTPEYTEEEVLDAVQAHEPAGTSEVAEELGIKRPSADYRLRQLEEDEKVTKDMIGNSLAWSVTEEA